MEVFAGLAQNGIYPPDCVSKPKLLPLHPAVPRVPGTPGGRKGGGRAFPGAEHPEVWKSRPIKGIGSLES